MTEKKHYLFIIDPLDPVLSLEHQRFLINRHLDENIEIDLILVEDNNLYRAMLPANKKLLPSLITIITEVIKDINQKKNWYFKLEERPIPPHIINSYYTYPTIVKLYWKKIKPDIHKLHKNYDKAIFSLLPII